MAKFTSRRIVIKKFLALIVLLLTALLPAQSADAKGEEQHVYLPMPDGRYYEIPKSKRILGKDVVTCIAYSQFPEAYFNVKPSMCEGYTAAVALTQITQNFVKTPAKVIALPSGIVFSNNSGLVGENLLCKIKMSYPTDFGIYSTYFTTENLSCSPLKIDLDAARSDALSTHALKFGGAIAVFFLMTIGIVGKPRNTLLKQGRWFSAIGAAIAVAAVSQGGRNFDDYLFILSINIVVYITIGLLCGMIWFKVTESPNAVSNDLIADENNTKADVSITKEHDAAFPSNTHWENALRELEAGSRDELLWAKCVVACNGDLINAKAEYLKLRVIQLAETKDA